MGIGFRCARRFENVRSVGDRPFNGSFVRGMPRFASVRVRGGLFERPDGVRGHTSTARTGWRSAWARNVNSGDHRLLRRVQSRRLVQCCTFRQWQRWLPFDHMEVTDSANRADRFVALDEDRR